MSAFQQFRQPGPVTRAIRGLRPNEAPTWEIRQAQIDAEEREAMRALRRRVAQAVSDGIDFLDATGGDPDLEADFSTSELAADGSLYTLGRSSDDEPSIGGDDRETDEAERGFGDMDGGLEQMGAYA